AGETGSSRLAAPGLRCAREPDDRAAVSARVAEQRKSTQAVFLGVCWGLGHTLARVAVGAVMIALRAEMSARLTDVFELGVAMMLVALGTRAIRRAARQGPMGPSAMHQHGAIVHRHPALSKHVHVGRWTLARR